MKITKQNNDNEEDRLEGLGFYNLHEVFFLFHPLQSTR